MKKMMKQILALVLSVFILMSCAACGETNTPGSSADASEYLNTDGSLPIVKEGYEKTLKVAIRMYSDSGEPDSQWFYQFVKNEMNINLEVQKVSGSEQISLLLVDGDLPDIIIGGGFGTADLMSSGANEGLFADLAPYITETGTPNLYKLFNENPEYREAVSDRDGHIWSLGYINDTRDRGQISRAFINYEWLEDAGLETPATLDEFVDMLRAFKKRGDNIIPMSGSWENNNPFLILLNAFGYLTEDPQGMGIALRNGEPVLPVADREVYGEYLKLMHTLYEEGLIDPNFFTTDATTSRAIIAAGRTGYIPNAPFTYMTSYTDWWGAQPLTSEYNSTRQWPAGNAAMTCGGFVVSAESENIELAMAFADWFFDPTGANYNMSVNGPAASQTDYIYGENANVNGFKINEETFAVSYPDYENNTSGYSSKNDYLGKEVYLWGYRILGLGKGNVSSNLEAVQYGYTADQIIDNYPDVSDPAIQGDLRKQTEGDGEMHFRSALEDTMVPYVVEGFPGKVYLDAETSTMMANIMMIIREYATQETAKFITGRKSFDELDNYFDEIERLGAKQVLETYKTYYESTK